MKRTACWLLWFVLVPGAIAAPAAAIEATPPDGPPARARALWERWPQTRFVDVAAPCLRPADLSERIEALVARHPEIERQRVGRSIEGRPIQLLKVGHGATHILLWSQMHGDEPSATPALLDLADELLSRPDEPANAAILDRLTLILVPMLNPDGAEAYRRRNAQGIDINRDALNLATPEGRLLKELRRAWRPALGFNLHDQNRRRTVGNSDTLATISVLAVVGDEAKTVTPERRLSLRAAGAIAAVLSDFIPGGVGRFDDTWSERSFGDNLTAWGTPVVLIESGGVLPGESLEKLTRLNFVALLEVLHAVAIGSLTG
ncbi:MAG: M14 family zinc carboxypeptidase, partial [Thermoanaerobaculia bacterium]